MVITRNTRLLMLLLALVTLAAVLVALAVMLHTGHPILPGHLFADSSTPDVIIHNH